MMCGCIIAINISSLKELKIYACFSIDKVFGHYRALEYWAHCSFSLYYGEERKTTKISL